MSRPNSEGAGGFSENFFVPEYTLTDQVHLLGAFMDTFAAPYRQLQDIDFRDTANQFEVPTHRPLFEQPDEFVDYMNNTVLAGAADN